MSCEQVEELAGALVRNAVGGALRAQAMAHAAGCPACRERLRLEREVADALAALAAADAAIETPSRVEDALRRAWDLRAGPTTGHGGTGWRAGLPLLAMAASVILLLAPLWIDRMREASNGGPGMATLPSTPPDEALPPANEGVATEFFTLLDEPGLARSPSYLVRVRVPRAALQSFGIAIDHERAGEPVQAELVVGEDGIARAIRFVAR